MTIIVIILTVTVAVLFLALYSLFISYEDYLDMEEENKRLSHLLEESFYLQNDSLETYREMLSAACREQGFWEVENDVEDFVEVEVDE